MDACNNTEEKNTVQKAWTSALKLNRMHLNVTMFVNVCVCTNITRQVYCLPHA